MPMSPTCANSSPTGDKVQLNLAHAKAELNAALASLPPAPSDIRYFDPYSERVFTLENADRSTRLQLAVNGRSEFVDLEDMPEFAQHIHRRFLGWCFGRYAPEAILKVHRGLADLVFRLGGEVVLFPFVAGRMDLKDYWYEEVLPFLISGNQHMTVGVKAYLHFMCSKGLGCLSQQDTHFVRSLRGPHTRLYRSVELGEAFVPDDDQAAVVRYLDEFAADLKKGTSFERHVVQDAVLLAISFEHAMRPIQQSKVMFEDIKIRTEPGEGAETMHICFYRAKQKGKNKGKKFPMVRKVHEAWTPIVLEYHRQRQTASDSPSPSLYVEPESVDRSNAAFTAGTYLQLKPGQISARVRAATKQLLGQSRSCTAFRHSAAQRLVDAGASQEEVSAFLGHSSLRTGGIYYGMSRNTVELINKALGLSPVFSRNVRNLTNRLVSEKHLANAPEELQVSGSVHGMPVPKIGRCDVGIGLCPKHPVFSCYGCEDFHPLKNIETHEQVARDIRSVVQLFIEHASDHGSASPFGQLSELLEQINAVIRRVRGDTK